jgi:virulence-associated protein VapD
VTQSFKAANFYNDFVTTYNQQLDIEEAQCTGTYNVTEINTFTLQLIFTYTDGSTYVTTNQIYTVNGLINTVTQTELFVWVTDIFTDIWDNELSLNGIQWVPSSTGYEFTNWSKQIQNLTLVRNITIIGNCI